MHCHNEDREHRARGYAYEILRSTFLSIHFYTTPPQQRRDRQPTIYYYYCLCTTSRSTHNEKNYVRGRGRGRPLGARRQTVTIMPGPSTEQRRRADTHTRGLCASLGYATILLLVLLPITVGMYVGISSERNLNFFSSTTSLLVL